MAHEYRHIRQAKHAGRGHDPAGIAGSKPGELAVICPTCTNDALEPRVGDELTKISSYLLQAQPCVLC